MKGERVVLSEAEIVAFMARFPSLGRHEVVFEIVRAGPLREHVEAALAARVSPPPGGSAAA